MAKYRPAPHVPSSACETVRHMESAPVVPCLMCEPMRVIEPYVPPASSVILVMKRVSWDLIVAGKKTLEIKGKPLNPKRYPVGQGGELWGTVVVGPVLVIRTNKEWRTLLPLHCWNVEKRPYEKTYALMLCNIEAFTTSIARKKPHREVQQPCAAEKNAFKGLVFQLAP